MILKALGRSFDIPLIRARSVLRATIFHLVLVAGITAVKISTNALYLARRDPRDLPYLYLATAALVTVVTVVLGRRLAQSSAKPILRSSLTWVAAVLLALSAAAIFDLPLALAILYVVGEAYATALSVLFWARLGEVFDVRAQKRVFGLISAAGMVGATAAGLLARSLATVVPAVSFCVVTAVSLLLIRPLLGAERGPASVRRERTGFTDGIRYAAVDGFPRSVAGLVLLLSVQTAAVDFVFRTGTHRFAAGNEAEMTALFGSLNAIVGVLAILFQTALTSTLLRRAGVFVYLSIVPALSVGVAGWAFALPASIVPIFVLKVLEMMASFSLNQPGLQLLYNPMPAHLRGSVRAVIDGAVKKVGGAVGGVVLLLVGKNLDEPVMLGLVVAVAGLLLLSIRVLRPLYLTALEQKLGGREVAKIPTIDAADRSTREQLIRALKDGDAKKTLAALSVLEEVHGFDFHEHIGTLIAHPSDEVRVRAIELIGKTKDPSYAPFLVSVIQSEGRHPKAMAARALMIVDPARARAVLEPVLKNADSTEDRGLVGAALVALIAPKKPEDSEEAVDPLAERALRGMIDRAKTTADRRELAWVLGMLGPGRFAATLDGLLGDPSATVQNIALEAVTRAPDAAYVPRLIRLLADRRLSRLARTALAAQGDAVVPDLAKVLDDRRADILLRVQIPRVLREIGTTAAVNAMLFSNRQDDAYLRTVIIEELCRLRRQKPGLEFDRAQTQGAILRRLTGYTYYRPMAEDFAMSPAVYGLLHRAVHDRVQENLAAALHLLGLLVDPNTMENALNGFKKGTRTARSDALEVIDVALAATDIRAEVLSHLEPPTPSGDPARAKDRAFQLVEGKDLRLAMIAYETLRRAGERPPTVREPTSGEPLMPKSIIDRVFLLQSVQLFRGLSVDDLTAVASLTTEGHAEPRQVIYSEGELGESLYVIISGEIHLLRGGQPLLDMHVGDSFGQTSILDGGPRPVTAKAGDEGCEFVRLERQPFMDLMADRPELMRGMFVELAARIRELIELTEGQPSAHAPAPVMTSSKSQPPAALRG
ncbi:MAG: cyclic nucleotide-binding domain-containing protein [Myxococcota bacterium]